MAKKLLALLFLIAFLPAAAARLFRPGSPVARTVGSHPLFFPCPTATFAFGIPTARTRGTFAIGSCSRTRDVLTVVAPELGEAADCFILRCGGETAMIDCGLMGPENLVPRLLDQLGIDRFDFVINTHPHDDHVSGIIEMLPHYGIDVLYTGFERHDNNLNKRLYREAMELGIPVEQLEPPVDLWLGAARLSLYQVPWGDNTNNRSMVTRVTLGSRSLLLTADIGQSGVAWMLEKYGAESFQADILKAPHHGIDRMPPELLAAAKPQAVFITYYPHSRNEKTAKAAPQARL